MHRTLAALLPVALLLSIRGCSSGALSTTLVPESGVTHQSVPQILLSIEERLKALDEAFRGRTQLKKQPVDKEVDLEGLARRLEAVETRLSRIEASLDTRLNTLSENLGRRQGKDEINAETTNQKLQTISDTIFSKMGYLEAKLDEKFNLLASKIEKYPTEVQGTIASSEKHLNKDMATVEKKANEILEKIKSFESRLFSYVAEGHRAIKELIKSEMKMLDANERQIGYDLWGKSVSIEKQVQQLSVVTNLTHNSILELNRKTGHHGSSHRHPHYAPQISESPSFGSDTRVLQKLNQLGREIDFRLSSLHDVQNQFKTSCRRIQDREEQTEKSIENYLILIYEKFYNETNETKRMVNAYNENNSQNSDILYKLLEKQQTMQSSLKKNEDVIIGDAKNMFKALNVLKDEMLKYFREFNTESVASKVAEDLKPILLKFVDESVLETRSPSKDSAIFQELENIISQNKNISALSTSLSEKGTANGLSNSTESKKDHDFDYVY
ncbi:Hypothetical predicted protein [Cloeon dipterum]|uniref:Paramyosin n=1 Tax=Cloeon dipterum TaxID=197152 RepID=A0A8S1CFK5_9INSE|nr:Hypothetical predicted protein [Cloeon dipterum]